MADTRVVVVGAGVGGLVAALLLAARGVGVTLVEAADAPGGKMRVLHGVDAGPTVLTMRWVFDEICAEAGTAFADVVGVRAADVLARHAWGEARLDLFADARASADAIGVLAGAGEARGFSTFLAEARRIYEALERPFLRAAKPTQLGLVTATGAADGIGGLANLWRIRPYQTMWDAIGRHFRDPRLRQLFGRYATYAGSSPFAAPATLMLIAHVESSGVWLVEGGMHALARGLEGLARARGVDVRYGARVDDVLVKGGRAAGVRLADGERIAADAVVLNGDPGALAAGLLGAASARTTPGLALAERSLSAVTWTGVAHARGFPLSRHNVFFGADYPREFADLGRGELPDDPTIYICAQDRDAAAGARASPDGPERLHVIVNAPALGDVRPLTPAEIRACEQRIFARAAAAGLTLETVERTIATPTDFAALFPGSGGALYGRATHGAAAAFRRPGARTKVPGLYLAGGATHPGAGVPMAALSGRLAAYALIADLERAARAR